ncbi:MAG: hypothetical protein MMC23_004384 [Stictis urceolatum]|nr:hypothetical protein [Stictis urceolata]
MAASDSTRNYSQRSDRRQSSSSSQGGSKSTTREPFRDRDRIRRHRRPGSANSSLDAATSGQYMSSSNSTHQAEPTTIGANLEQILWRKFLDPLSPEFIERDGLSASSSTESPASTNTSQSDGGSILVTQPSLASKIHQRLFGSLTQSLLELVSLRFGALGCQESSNNPTRFIVQSLSLDRIDTIVDTGEQTQAIPEYSDHKVRQMIELWLIHHPMSFTISKTLLLSRYRNGDLDEALLAVILADVAVMTDDESAESTRKLMAWAEADVHRRPSRPPSLSTIQTLLLLGWHSLCFSSARRGYCYIECARLGILELLYALSTESNLERDWINGVDVGKVESELLQRLYWATFAFETWFSLQMDVPSSSSLSADVPVDFPPIDETTSTVLTLDIESGNIATLAVQKRSLRELWPLSHVASIVSPIYALYPHQHLDAAPPSGRWEHLAFSRLHHLLKGPGSIFDVCHNVRTILCESLHQLQFQPEEHPFKTLLTTSYSIIIIHLLFPRSNQGGQTIGIGGFTLTDALKSISDIKDALQLDSILSTSASSRANNGDSELVKASIQTLGLDTCARALWFIYEASRTATGEEQSRITLHQAELIELCKDLYVLSKDSQIQMVSTARTIKRTLKEVKQQLEGMQLLPAASMGQWMDSGTSTMFDMMGDRQLLPQIASTTFSGLESMVAESNVLPWQ